MDVSGLFIHAAHAQEAVKAAQPSVAAMFGLDWKLFLAQLINFSIVLFVLWKWVFGPVAKGLANRTAKIEKSLADAKQITEDKETFESWKNAEMGKVRQEASAIMTQAKQEAVQLKNLALEETKQEQNRIVTQAQAKMEADKQKTLTEIKEELAGMVVNATQTILQEKIDPAKDKELIKKALEKAAA